MLELSVAVITTYQHKIEKFHAVQQNLLHSMVGF